MNVMINVVKNSQNCHILVPFVLLLWLLKQAKKRYFLKNLCVTQFAKKWGSLHDKKECPIDVSSKGQFYLPPEKTETAD